MMCCITVKPCQVSWPYSAIIIQQSMEYAHRSSNGISRRKHATILLQKHPKPHYGSRLHALCKPWYLRAWCVRDDDAALNPHRTVEVTNELVGLAGGWGACACVPRRRDSAPCSIKSTMSGTALGLSSSELFGLLAKKVTLWWRGAREQTSSVE